MPATTGVLLATGLWSEGACHREALLRAPTGHDEAFVQDALAGLPVARQATELLARCLVRIGAVAPVPPEAAAALTVGDREALLLHVRRLALGDRLATTVACSREGCGTSMDLELRLPDLLQPPLAEPLEPWTEVPLGKGARQVTVRCRLPTGADQEAVAEAAADPADAARALALRCVAQARRGGKAVAPARLGAAQLDALSAALMARDPQAEARVTTQCPECGAARSVQLDAGSFLLEELRGRAKGLGWEVHHLALHYHWSEHDILAMPAGRRRMYLGLLEQALEGGSG